MQGITDEDEILRREKEWMNAWLEKDGNTLMDILSADFLLSSARGNLMDKAEWMVNALGPYTCRSFIWKETKVRIYDATAVVNALVEQDASVGIKDWSGIFMLTDVWVKQGSHWRVVSRHGTGPLANQ